MPQKVRKLNKQNVLPQQRQQQQQLYFTLKLQYLLVKVCLFCRLGWERVGEVSFGIESVVSITRYFIEETGLFDS